MIVEIKIVEINPPVDLTVAFEYRFSLSYSDFLRMRRIPFCHFLKFKKNQTLLVQHTCNVAITAPFSKRTTLHKTNAKKYEEKKIIKFLLLLELFCRLNHSVNAQMETLIWSRICTYLVTNKLITT